jgi:hypothetical protein
MKTLFFLILFIFMTGARAESVPLPSSVPGADEVVSEFRNQIMMKMVDLGKNYISTIRGNTLVFTNTDSMKCNDVKNEAGEHLASIQYTYSLRGKELLEQVSYTGCNSQISLVEDTITEGENLAPMDFKDIMKGKRPIELASSETKRIFKISNGEGEELFSVSAEKKENSQSVIFNILTQKFLEVNYQYSAETTRATLTFYGYEATYVRKHGRWGLKNRMDPFKLSVVSKKDGSVNYFNNDGNLISLSGFSHNKSAMDSTIQTLEDIFEYHTYYFPKTESTKSGNQAQRLMEELRQAQTRLLANTDIALVKKLIQDLISSAELGQIIDNRPKQK